MTQILVVTIVIKEDIPDLEYLASEGYFHLRGDGEDRYFDRRNDNFNVSVIEVET